MSESDPPTGGPGSNGPTLSADGTLEGRLSRLEPASPGTWEPVDPSSAPLELAEVAPPVVAALPIRPEPASSKPRVPLFIVFGSMGLGVLILIFALVKDVISPPPMARADEVRAIGEVEQHLSVPTPKGRAVIQSEPDGAEIVVNGQVIGTTPWAGDNVIGTQTFEVRRAGYQSWKGRLPDRADATLSVRLTH